MGYGLSRTVVLFSTGPLLKKLWPLEVDLLTSKFVCLAFGFVCSVFAEVGFISRLKIIGEKYIAVLKQILLLQKYCPQIQKWITELRRSTNQLQVAITSSKVDLWKKGQQFWIAHTS